MLEIFHPTDFPADASAVRQINTCLQFGSAHSGVLCADHHKGYSMPIGGVVAYTEHVSPSGVGYDIGCGNKAVATSLFYSDIRADLNRIMDEIVRRISFGMGRPNDEPVDHPVLDEINSHSDPGVRGLTGLARKQLGTVGGGNHYVDLFREDGTERVWIGVHFGSRGPGHKTASGFLARYQGKEFTDHATEGEMDSPPILFHTSSPLGYMYIEAMETMGRFAYAGRDVVVDKVLEILGSPAVIDEVHNHHNFAWWEGLDDCNAWVVRKGATPLAPGQRGFIGSSMGEDSVIVVGDPDHEPDAWDIGDRSLFSAPHGAGRAMSRTEAKGKINRKTGEVKRKGKIDWVETRQGLVARGIEIRGGDADEAPLAYKRLPAVLEAHAPYVAVQKVLRPIGVAMAGPNIFDPFKD